MRTRSPAECPVCGTAVPPHARACPECGADERSGWNEESAYLDGVDLPDDDSDRHVAVRKRSASPSGLRWRWWITAVLALGALLATLFLGYP